MSPIKNRDKANPKSKASVISIIFFTWMTELFYKGWRRPLTDDDIFPPLHSDSSYLLGQRLYRNWEKHIEDCARKQKKKPSFKLVVFKTFYKPFLFYGIFSMLEECVIRLVQVMALDALIDYFNRDLAKLNSYLMAQIAVAGIIMTSVFFMLSFHWSISACHDTCTEIRIAVSSMIFQKTLRLSQSTLKYFSVGQLITMMSGDVHRFDQQDLHLNHIWIAPLQLAIVIYLLVFYYEFGWTSTAGLGFLLIFVFAQYFIAKYIGKVRLNKIIASHARMKIVLEIMQAFHTIKMYALENNFYRIARESRLKELGFLKKTMIVRILNISISLILTKMTIFVALLFYVTDSRPINSERVFITILLYEHVRINFVYLFVHGCTDLAEISVTLTRLTDFFLLEEQYEGENYQIMPAPNAEVLKTRNVPCGLNIQSLFSKWHPKQEHFTLKDINLAIKSGEFVVIIGSPGAGKSSLMAAFLGEIPICKGSVLIQGKIAYIPKTPWLFHGTIRENILFGLPYDEEWYNEVLEVCTISTDIDRMLDGDATDIFTAVLSTGQKARINLARAVYSKADIFLMDDPFHCIDVRLSRYILENCIKGILKNAAVLLISHQIYFLEAASRIAIMANGEFIAEGSYEDLVKQGIQFTKEVEEELDDILMDDDAETLTRKQSYVLVEEFENQMLVVKETNSLEDVFSIPKSVIAMKEMEAEVYESHRNKGSFSSAPPASTTIAKGIRLYWLYLRCSTSKVRIFFMVFIVMVLQLLYSGSDFWLEFWISFEEHSQGHIPLHKVQKNPPEFYKTRSFYIIVYFSIIPALIIVTIVESVIMVKICTDSSLSLFCQLTDSLLRASSSFIDTNKVGHGINKFSKDMIIIDELLPQTVCETMGIFFEIIGAICILGSIEILFLIPSIIFLVLCVLVYRIYHRSAAALKRIESNARSPVYGHIANSLEGMMTIRAFNREEMFMNIFDDHMDNHTAAWTLYLDTSAWLAVIVDCLSIFLISSLCVVLILEDSYDAVGVGLVIAKAVELSILTQIGVTETRDMETEMISVERVLEYMSTPPEGERETPEDVKLSLSWPEAGRIEFEKVTVRGYTGRNVLRNVSFVIEPGQKVGIVGRSGSGKSSLFNSLFRILNVTTGKILIDGVNTKSIGLHDLRKRINVIPQRPHVFNGTLRSNIDPFEEFEDKEIWTVLEEVGLYETVKNMDEGLSSLMCPETGYTFSDSDTQLLSLARVLIRKSKILCCDEATSYLDPEAQAYLLRKLHKNFKDSTVISIAHKVHTVIDYDVIMVLEAGQIVDAGEPYKLIMEQGPFFQLIDNFGKSTKDEIIKMAKDAFDKRRHGVRLNASNATKFNLNEAGQKSKTDASQIRKRLS